MSPLGPSRRQSGSGETDARPRFYFRAAGAAEVRWSVFESSGAWLGDVVVPSRLQVLEVGVDYVLGIWHDELDEESVRVYSLLKPEVGGE